MAAIDLAGLREHVGPGPSDAVLTDLLAAAQAAITARYGTDAGPVTEYLRPFGQWVRLSRPASAISSVLEGRTSLASELYEIWAGGADYVRRLDSSSNVTPWTDWVEVAYTPVSEEAERDRVTIALVDLDLNRASGLTGITVGPWSEQYTQDDEAYRKTREAILESIRPPKLGTW